MFEQRWQKLLSATLLLKIPETLALILEQTIRPLEP